MRWDKCDQCDAPHGRERCPYCQNTAHWALKKTFTHQGAVTARRVMNNCGKIIWAGMQNEKLCTVRYDHAHYYRDDNTQPYMRGVHTPEVKVMACGKDTVSAVGNDLYAHGRRYSVETDGQTPLFDANSKHVFFLGMGEMYKSDSTGFESLFKTMRNVTRFWAGETHLFGFFQAGPIQTTFLYDIQSKRLNDQLIKLNPAQVIESNAVVGTHRIWVFLARKTGGDVRHECHVFDMKGQLIHSIQVPRGDANHAWLSGNLSGQAAVGDRLLVPTDQGIVQIAADTKGFSVAKEFPATEPFVNAADRLFVGDQGVYVHSENELIHLSL
jgi:hypothetical protein